ncbi:methyltransferase domain-containing protein [Methylobacterium planeticum]|uniref:Class I SAM-dependent methyltransferase n=1 Tax=Methylobacterium planeticum TaxID=2615211 RepID=A0A6N6MVT4_9HYPH|nr:methyltransferase domain-containing protein [Methylobacterium planeticum]KAB1075272.1 class I SAM-dependent methyltransferase [Methylobacterium planeticum]
MRDEARHLGMSVLGLAFLGVAWTKEQLRGYAPDRLPKTDAEGRIAYLLNVFASLRRFLPEGTDLRGRDVLEVSPGASRGNGALFLAMGARSYHAIDVFGLAAGEDPALYGRLLDRFGETADAPAGCAADFAADLARARALTAGGPSEAFSYAVGRSFDIPALADGRDFDLIVSCAAFEHYDDVPGAIAGLTRVARPGCVTAHIIDMQTHSRWIREHDPNNIYRYPEALYRVFACPGQPNRKRPVDYVRGFEAQGWRDVRFEPARTIAPALRKASLTGLAAPFDDPAMAMTVLDGALTARRP